MRNSAESGVTITEPAVLSAVVASAEYYLYRIEQRNNKYLTSPTGGYGTYEYSNQRR